MYLQHAIQMVTIDIITSENWNKPSYVTIMPPPFRGELIRQAVILVQSITNKCKFRNK